MANTVLVVAWLALPGAGGWWPWSASGADDTNHGFPDCIQYHYDSRGLALSIAKDRDCNGSAELMLTYTYDDWGRLLVERRSTPGPDATALGQEILVITTYGPGGAVAMVARFDDPDQAPVCTVHRHDDQQRHLASYRDLGCDGPPLDTCISYLPSTRYPDLALSTDRDCDGTPDTRCQRYELDAGGLKARQVLLKQCGSDHGAVCWTFVHDPVGLMMNRTVDDGCDGVQDICVSHDYDALGRLISRLVDYRCDGVAEEWARYGYNDQGYLAAEARSPGTGETTPRCFAMTYDTFGNIIRKSVTTRCP